MAIPGSQAWGRAGLSLVALAEGNVDVAREMLKEAKKSWPDQCGHPLVARAVAEVELSALTGGKRATAAEVAALEQTIAADKDRKNLQARFDLSCALLSQGNVDGAVDMALKIVAMNKTWSGTSGTARDLLIKIFDSLGPTNDITVKGRRRLSNALFV